MKKLPNPKWIHYHLDNDIEDQFEKKHFRIGQALDTLITDPEEFDKQFVIIDTESVGGLMGKFIRKLPLTLVESTPENAYLEAYEYAGFKVPPKTVISWLWNLEKYRLYYLHLKRLGDSNQIILTKDEYEEVKHAKFYLLDQPYIKRYFNSGIILYQVPIYFKHLEVDCKAMLDMVHFNLETRVITPIDLKTTGKSILGFPNNYLYLGYYLQAGFYTLALLKALNGQAEVDHPDKEMIVGQDSKWSLNNFKFFVTEKLKKQSNPARIFSCTPSEIELAKSGGWANNRYYPGYDELVQTYKWHLDNDYWDLPKSLVDSEGEIELSLLHAK